MIKTLYISDLDGTLLQSNQQISKTSCKIINTLVQKGVYFSYATARSLNTAQKATAGLTAQIPLILHNGTFIIDNSNGEKLLANTFSEQEANEIYQTLTFGGISPLVYALINGEEKFSYDSRFLSKGQHDFILTRKNDPRRNPLNSKNTILQGEKYYFTCIDGKDKLTPLYDKLSKKYNCLFQQDIYSKEHWLEILPKAATKANAALQLKEMLGCKRLVSFGDSLNDLSLAEISDEFYAVSNAADKVKAAATDIIGSNNEDAVALWLQKNTK